MKTRRRKTCGRRASRPTCLPGIDDVEFPFTLLTPEELAVHRPGSRPVLDYWQAKETGVTPGEFTEFERRVVDWLKTGRFPSFENIDVDAAVAPPVPDREVVAPTTGGFVDRVDALVAGVNAVADTLGSRLKCVRTYEEACEFLGELRKRRSMVGGLNFQPSQYICVADGGTEPSGFEDFDRAIVAWLQGGSEP
jgi:hypothetical protein